MGLFDMLKQYASALPGQANASASEHFQEAAQSAPADVVAQGISDAMKSSETPPFGEMMSQMFRQANPQQQAGMLNQMLSGLAPGALAGLAGGVLGKFLPASAAGAPLTPDQASKLSPDQVQQIAEHAEQHNPTVIDKMGDFYAQHPGLVKTLGGAALAIVLAKMSNRMRG
ncbi:MAG: hypothetical protein ABI881_02585 [Betaproteobacteria bacterium]